MNEESGLLAEIKRRQRQPRPPAPAAPLDSLRTRRPPVPAQPPPNPPALTFWIGLTHQQRRIVIGMAAALLAIVVAMLVLLASVERPSAAVESPATRMPPQVSALQIAEILTTGGLIVENAQPVLNPVEGWRAQQALEFTVIHEQMAFQVIVLSYESAAAAGVDAFMTQLREAYADWPLIQMSNLLVLCSPQPSANACQAVVEQLNSVLIAPFYGLDDPVSD